MALQLQTWHVVSLLVLSTALPLVTVVQAEKTRDPFYVIAHMANNRESLDWAVSQGANGIESDLQFDNNGNPAIFDHGSACDCLCSVMSHHICHEALHETCSGILANDDAAAHVQHVARLSGIALYVIDSKVNASMTKILAKAGSAVVHFLDKNLFGYGYKGKVIIGAGKINTFDYIQAAAITAKNSSNHGRYFFTFDQEGDDYYGVMAMLSRFTTHRVHGTGCSSCFPSTYYKGIASATKGEKLGENGLSYIWTLDKKSSMRKYIRRGVQGIMTNRVKVARKLADGLGLRIATPSDPIPVSTSMISSPVKCGCQYHPGGCSIAWPAPPGRACKCSYKGLRACGGSVVSCDRSKAKCANPDESWEACKLGGGDCGAY